MPIAFNAYSLSWDPFQPETATGEAIEEWAKDSDLLILNDGSTTNETQLQYHPERHHGGKMCTGPHADLPRTGQSTRGEIGHTEWDWLEPSADPRLLICVVCAYPRKTRRPRPVLSPESGVGKLQDGM